MIFTDVALMPPLRITITRALREFYNSDVYCITPISNIPVFRITIGHFVETIVKCKEIERETSYVQ